jgi:hypothetical protein
MGICPLNCGIHSNLGVPLSKELDILGYMYTEASHQDARAIVDCIIVTGPELLLHSLNQGA